MRGSLGAAMNDLQATSGISSTIMHSRGGQPVPNEIASNQAATIMTSVSISLFPSLTKLLCLEHDQAKSGSAEKQIGQYEER